MDDTLSEVLRAVRLKGAVFFDVDTTAPWVAEAPPAQVVARAVMPGAEHVIEYHVVTAGSCWAQAIEHDIAPVRLEAGDVVAFPQGDAHVVSSAPGMRGDLDLAVFDGPHGAAEVPILLNLDGGGSERTHLVCGFLGCDLRPFNPLLECLPRVLHIPGGRMRRAWFDGFARFAILEANAKRAGAAGILAKLGELMFAELVRGHLEMLPDDSKGWLAGLRDRHIGRALALMHAEPGREWTLVALAGEAGLSRSSFAERFSTFVGISPMQYLQRWRLQIAASRLADGIDGIAVIAGAAGYESEAAFGRAFKKAVGSPPAEWRSRRIGRQTRA